MQSMSNQTSDVFTFDVTNGISSISGLVFHLIIIPRDLYVETRPVQVVEGGSAALAQENLHVLTEFYEDKVADYLIVSSPKQGRIVEQGKEGTNCTIFTMRQLKARQIRVSYENGWIEQVALQILAFEGREITKQIYLGIKYNVDNI